jgi:hypothetical protein
MSKEQLTWPACDKSLHRLFGVGGNFNKKCWRRTASSFKVPRNSDLFTLNDLSPLPRALELTITGERLML